MTTITHKKTDTLNFKNKMTGKAESIVMREVTINDCGFSFFVDNESEAYRAAYQYRYNCGVMVDYAKGSKMWLVTVFNKAKSE